MHVPFAFSISHFVSSVGADAGFAAIIGLAILVLLYFAQARETSTLREEATAASQRVGELERRVSQLGQPQAAPAPRPAGAPQSAAAGSQPAPFGARPLAKPVSAATAKGQPLPIPAAPAGVGAPALFSATRLIPALGEAAPLAAGAVAQKAAPEPTAPAAAPEGPPAPAPAPAPASAVAPAAAAGATALATPPPATAAGGAEPVPAVAARPVPPGAARPAPTPPPAPAGSNGTGEHPVTPAPSGGGAPPRIQIRPGTSAPAGGLSMGGARRPSRVRRWIPVVITLVIAAAVVAVLLVVTSTGGNPNSTGATQSTNAPTAARGAAFSPSSVSVAVLNGTNVFQLAHRVAQKLSNSSYHLGTVATAPDQTHTTTAVAYLPGHRSAGLRIAKTLGLGPSTVQPADQTAKTVACPPPAACSVKVIVTVGSDLSTTH